MKDNNDNDNLFQLFSKKGLPPLEQLQQLIRQPLKSKGDFAEIYVEDVSANSFRLSENIISDISGSYTLGAGIRVVRGNKTGYSYTESLSQKNIKKCLDEASRIAGTTGDFGVAVESKKHNLYDVPSPLLDSTHAKVELLKRTEKRAFSLSPLVEKVEVNYSESIANVLIVNSLGIVASDTRPMLRFSVTVILKKGDLRERGFESGGGRVPFSWFQQNPPEKMAEAAVNQALVLLESKPAPAGEMEVILGAGESGILLHESIGHPLEADFNYRGSSAFSGRIGEKVASPQCTIIDQGDMPLERGSINIDDEGNSSGKSVLIEAGILKTYMFDRITGSFSNSPPLTVAGNRSGKSPCPV